MEDRYWQLVHDLIKDADIILHVIDGRWGTLTASDRVKTLCEEQQKPLIYVINKSDLVTTELLTAIRHRLSPSVIFSSARKYGLRNVRASIGIASSKAKKKEVKVGVVGYPNVGKSSVINALCGRSSAKSSSRAGTTKGLQNIRISTKIMLIDSPGVLPSEELTPEQQALIDSKNIDHIKDPVLVALALLTELVRQYGKQWVENAFDIPADQPIDEGTLAALAERQHRLKRGGEPDIDVIARQIIQAWQKGKYKIGDTYAQLQHPS